MSTTTTISDPTKMFAGKVALVTGGTAGIGRATAVAFAEAGASVVVTGRREVEGAESVALIEQAGGRGLFVRADVSLEADVVAMVAATVSHFGRLDFAFNNAGVHLGNRPITEDSVESIDQTLAINVRGPALCMKHEIPAILKAGGGAIVNNASVLGLRPIARSALYNASKAAVIALTKTVALQFASQHVRVNAVCPAIIETDMTASSREDAQMNAALLAMHPVGRFGLLDEVAAAVLYLCSPKAGFTTGIALGIDGGFGV